MSEWIGELVNETRANSTDQVTHSPIHQLGRFGVGGSNSVVESQPSKLLVAGSIPVSRSSLRSLGAMADDDAGELSRALFQDTEHRGPRLPM